MKAKKISALLTILVFLVTIQLMCINSYAAETGFCGVGDNYENVMWSYDPDTKTLTFSGTGDIAENNPFPWTRFKSVTKKIIIEDGITSIPNGAFQFYEAKELDLGNTVTSLGEYTFYCAKIEAVRIPGSVKTINRAAFGSCEPLSYVIIDEGVEAIDSIAFSGVGDGSSIKTTYRLPASIKNIHGDAFGSITREAATIYGKNDVAADFFKYLTPTYIDATNPIDISNVDIVFNEEVFDYTGEAVTPSPIVTYKVDDTHTATLYEGFDYSISYSDNINRGTATVTLTGIGVYSGTKKTTFDITTDISSCSVELSSNYILYDGSEKKPNITVKNGDTALVNGEDYDVVYTNNVEEGTATVNIIGQKKYRGQTESSFDIYKYDLGDDLISVELEYSDILYDGAEKKPTAQIKYGEIDIDSSNYYEIYYNNIEEGTAEVTIIGTDSCKGSRQVYFQIYKNDINKESCQIELEYNSVLYDGTPKEPRINLIYGDNELIKDQDYTIQYEDNTNEGIAKVTITGINSYKGETEYHFSIYKNDLATNNTQIELGYDRILYDGTEKTPSVKVTFDGKEVDPSNYTIAYANNINEGTATVTVTGIGTYKGSVTKQFEIYKYNLKDATISADATAFTYDGAAHSPNISVTYDGKALKADSDYKLTISPSVDAGIYKAVITGMGQYTGTREIEYTIDPIVIDNADVLLKDNIFTYDGSAKKPTTTVIHAGTTLTEGTHYTLTYKNNIDEGTAYAVVDGINNYSGHIEVSFMILAYQSGMDAVYKEDDTIMDGDYIYHIIDVEGKEVELSAPANTKITEVVVPAKITTENGDVFTVTSIGEKAFYKNSKIKKLTVANTVTSIENYAFYGCKNLTTIKIGNKIEIIGDSAFRKCTKLTSITLPKSIDKLGKNSFYGCSKLTTIIIKANQVVDVSKNAIKGISKKCVIKVPKKLVKKYKKEFDKSSGFKSTMKIKKI